MRPIRDDDAALTARGRRRGLRIWTAPCCRRSSCRMDTLGDSARAAPAPAGLCRGSSPGSDDTPAPAARNRASREKEEGIMF